jgi:GT2 family glycosyltransferase
MSQRHPDLGEELASLASQTYAGDGELIIADNSSADETNRSDSVGPLQGR